jgi:hypothetical protein
MDSDATAQQVTKKFSMGKVLRAIVTQEIVRIPSTACCALCAVPLSHRRVLAKRTALPCSPVAGIVLGLATKLPPVKSVGLCRICPRVVADMDCSEPFQMPLIGHKE